MINSLAAATLLSSSEAPEEKDVMKAPEEARQEASYPLPTSRAFWMNAVAAAAVGEDGMELDLAYAAEALAHAASMVDFP